MKKLIGLAVVLFLGVAACWWSISKRFSEEPVDFRARYALVAPENYYLLDLVRQSTDFIARTNFIRSDSVFTLSNVVRNVASSSLFIGRPGGTVWLRAPSGVQIKWTYPNAGGFRVRGGYSYLLQWFADSATSVIIWMASDDPLPVWLSETARVSGGGK